MDVINNSLIVAHAAAARYRIPSAEFIGVAKSRSRSAGLRKDEDSCTDFDRGRH